MKARITPTRNAISVTIPTALGAAFLDDFEQVDLAIARLAADEFCEGDRQIAEETQELADREAVAERNIAHALEERGARRFAARALFLRHRLGQFEQAPKTRGQARRGLR